MPLTGWSETTRIALDQLPMSLRIAASPTGSGELLWRARDALRAIDWLVTCDLAIVGGEVFLATGAARAQMTEEWHTEPNRKPGETWPNFVRRGAHAARTAITEREPEPRERFFLAVRAERNHRAR